MRTAAGEAKLPPLTPCNRGAVVDPADVKPVAGDLPDGVYRIEVTDAMLLNAGMPTRDVAENHGLYTITLNGGRFTWNQKADNVLHGPTSGSGVYQVDGDRLNWAWGPEMDGYVITLTWSVREDGALLMPPARTYPPVTIR